MLLVNPVPLERHKQEECGFFFNPTNHFACVHIAMSITLWSREVSRSPPVFFRTNLPPQEVTPAASVC